MFKKGIMMLVAIAIIATMVMAPVAAGAAGIEDSLYFDVNFDDQSVEDLAGNHTYDEMANMGSGDLLYEYDDEIGKNVLVLEGEGVLAWTNNNGETLNQYDLSQGLTLEAYVNITTDPAEEKVNMVIVEANDSALHFQEYNDESDLLSGFRCGDGSPGAFDMANTYVKETFPHQQWIHLLGVSDGTENRYYLDGQLMAVYARSQNTLQSMHNSGDGGIYIGESQLGAMWGPTAFYGKIAFVRIYKAAATNEQVGELYEAATGKEAPVIGNVTPLPSQAPVVTTPATFDLGLVSLAAVALSSVVAIKKRR